MKYQVTHLKLEQLVSYFKDGAVNLSPAFQRGKVWTPKLRAGLLSNILNGKPVPAVFLYKKSRGPKIEYVILDGKQRLESLLLFIGNQRNDLKIENWKSYIFTAKHRAQSEFAAEVNGQKKTLAELSNQEIISFRDYVIPVIEIDFDDSATLESIIQLFVDINQYGMKVSRFDIVKALHLHNPLLTQIFGLLAEKQRRGKENSIYRLKKKCAFVRVFKRLDMVQGADDENKVDIMWEKLLEFALYVRTSQHRKPVQILKEYISKDAHEGADEKSDKLSAKEVTALNAVFNHLLSANKVAEFSKTRWATEQTHFYILVTTLIDVVKAQNKIPDDLTGILIKFDGYMRAHGDRQPAIIAKYLALSAKQTTDASRRVDRSTLFNTVVAQIRNGELK